MKITWDTDVGAPGYAGRIVAENGRDILVAFDWDWPGVARTFGWSGDDDEIIAAGEYLDAHDGATADDPGYFEEVQP